MTLNFASATGIQYKPVKAMLPDGNWMDLGGVMVTGLSAETSYEESDLEPLNTMAFNTSYTMTFTIDAVEFSQNIKSILFGKNKMPFNEMPEPADVNSPLTEEWVPGKTPLF